MFIARKKYYRLKILNQLQNSITKDSIIVFSILKIEYVVLVLSLFLIRPIPLLSQDSDKPIIGKIDDKLKTITSIEYACLINKNDNESKGNSKDSARCFLMRDSLDEFGWKVNVTTEDFISIYNLGKYSLSSKKSKETSLINLSKEGINVNDVIYGSYFNNYLIDFLFENDFFKNLLINNDLDSYSIDMTSMDDKEVVLLNFIFKDNDLISQIKDSYIFELNTFNPVGVKRSYTFNKVKIEEELWLDSIRINSQYIIDSDRKSVV